MSGLVLKLVSISKEKTSCHVWCCASFALAFCVMLKGRHAASCYHGVATTRSFQNAGVGGSVSVDKHTCESNTNGDV